MSGVFEQTFYVAGFLAALGWPLIGARAQGLSAPDLYWAGLWGIAGAFVGGGLFAYASQVGAVAGGELTPGAILTGSKSTIGAFVGAGCVAWLYLRRRRLPAMPYADQAVCGIALGYAFSRVSCFLHGDCFGIPTTAPWGIGFPSGTDAYVVHLAAGWIAPDASYSLAVHPTQLYHALLGLVAFAMLLRIRNSAPGTRLALALMMYGAGRFAIQFFRGDSVPLWGPLDVNHIAALAMLAVGMLLWRLRPALATAREQPA